MGSFSHLRNAIFDRACVYTSHEGWGNPRNGWGNAVEISALLSGKLGVTPWKFRGNPKLEVDHLALEIVPRHVVEPSLFVGLKSAIAQASSLPVEAESCI